MLSFFQLDKFLAQKTSTFYHYKNAVQTQLNILSRSFRSMPDDLNMNHHHSSHYTTTYTDSRDGLQNSSDPECRIQRN